jgi:hypothetical protein
MFTKSVREKSEYEKPIETELDDMSMLHNGEENKAMEVEENEMEHDVTMKNISDYYMPHFHSNFDYCITAPIKVSHGIGYELLPSTEDLIRRFQHANITFFPYLNYRKNELVILFKCPIKQLRDFAAKIKVSAFTITNI